ncbi:uncharacterized protein LOC142905146 [Nelusetta ayraudi]|uniref:uncharacterized protein LOC142905146 n=1 Tax=Nelusetta ayraudi TaxID=303726 RepID=UPI003F6F4A2A
MARGVHLGITLVCLVLAVHESCQKANDDHVVQSNTREGRRLYGSHPQNQLRRAQSYAIRPTVIGSSSSSSSSTNTASNNQRPIGGSTQTLSRPSKSGVSFRGLLSTSGREALARKFNAELYQKSNSGTTLRKNPKVQDNRPAVNRQTWSSLQNAYEASKRLSSRPTPLWHQQPNRQQSAVRNRPTPARSPALYGREAAPQSGPGTRALTSATVRGTRVSRKRDSKSQLKLLQA